MSDDALARRLAALVDGAAAPVAPAPDPAVLDGVDGLVGLVGGLAGELAAVRAELAELREALVAPGAPAAGGPEGQVLRAVVAARLETGALARRVEEQSRLVGELTARVGSGRADDALEARLAMVEDVLEGMVERLEALARDGARTTTALLTDLTAAVADLQARAGAPADRPA